MARRENPRLPRTTPRALSILVVALGLVGILAGPSTGLLGAAPTSSAGVSPALASNQTWAYGGSNWANISGSTNSTNGSGTYSIHAFFGVQVVLTETNTSATTFELTANRTMLGAVYASYCRPNCASPIATGNLTLRAWEASLASANFTTTATVVGPHGPVPALAISNSSGRSSAVLTERATIRILSSPASHTATWNLSVQSHAEANIAFSPALGLVPNNLSATPNWSASSAFTGKGSWSAGFSFTHVPFVGSPVSASRSGNGSVAGSGNVTLLGADIGPVVLRGGISTTAIRLAVIGPFAVREGFILVPTGADLFGGSGDWQSDSVGGATAGTDAVDFAAAGGPHPTILASSTRYDASSTSTANQGILMAGPTPMANPAEGTGTQSVQAQPETAAQANVAAGCLLSGTCAGPSTHSPGRFPAGGLIVLTVAVVGLTVAVVGLVVARQPPRKEPPTPYASLYPPGTTGPAPPPGRPTAPPAPADDPLGHLW
ncbi:MAG: hypothetical protein L3K18_00810 [Thermoplasmata archaeon]|nr:hypothetical protein [Thermoplasmata archaeon]